jgi:multicomponent Na+:H+ antiporter subunit F
MSEVGNSLLQGVAVLSLGMLALALFFALIRLAKGPSLPDRVMALDLMGSIVVGMIGVYCIVAENAEFLDAGIVLGLIAFLSTVAFAKFIERGLNR